jgi:hypothetical protein
VVGVFIGELAAPAGGGEVDADQDDGDRDPQ